MVQFLSLPQLKTPIQVVEKRPRSAPSTDVPHESPVDEWHGTLSQMRHIVFGREWCRSGDSWSRDVSSEAALLRRS